MAQNTLPVLMEHMSVRSSLTLRKFCSRLARALGLPGFAFDSENETEWGLVVVDGVEYNVSRPYKPSMLQQLDSTTPDGCNISVSIVLYSGCARANDHVWVADNLVVPVSLKICNEFKTDVYYHRTWFGPGKNVPRHEVYRPSET
jgi:hypothetical protein